MTQLNFHIEPNNPREAGFSGCGGGDSDNSTILRLQLCCLFRRLWRSNWARKILSDGTSRRSSKLSLSLKRNKCDRSRGYSGFILLRRERLLTCLDGYCHFYFIRGNSGSMLSSHEFIFVLRQCNLMTFSPGGTSVRTPLSLPLPPIPHPTIFNSIPSHFVVAWISLQ